MPALVAGIHVLLSETKDVDGRDEPGHDVEGQVPMTKSVLGVIGGSGIYDLPGLQKVRTKKIKSPWGEPSAALRVGEIAGLPVVFLPRHDKGHRLSPSDINYRANIDVLKRAGVTDLVSLSASGSFKEELPPGTFVLVDQFVDRTHRRESSFFGKGCVAHVSGTFWRKGNYGAISRSGIPRQLLWQD